MLRKLIRPDEIMKYMTEDNYIKFIDYLAKKCKIPVNEPIWIIAEWSEKDE